MSSGEMSSTSSITAGPGERGSVQAPPSWCRRRRSRAGRFMPSLLLLCCLIALMCGPASAAEGEYLAVWEVGASDVVSSVAIAQDGSTIVAGAGSLVYVLDREGNVLWQTVAGSSVNGVGISPEGSYIGVAADKLYLFDRDGELLWTEKTTFVYRDVALSSDGRYIAAACDNGAIYLFDRNHKQLWDYDMGTDSYAIAISKNGRKIAIGCENGGVYSLNSRDGESWSYGTGKRVEGIALTPDARFVAAGSLDRCVYLSTGEGEHLWKYPTEDAIRSMAMTDEAEEIFAASGRTVLVLDRAGVVLQEITLGGRAESVAVTPDGSFLVVGAGDGDRSLRLFTDDATLIESEDLTGAAVNETEPLDLLPADVTPPPADDRTGAAAEPDTQNEETSLPALVLGWVENVLNLLFKPQDGFLA